jgi:CubicO group peptidase (beta-lactamase class C family)
MNIVSPAEVGMSAERLARIRPVMQGYIDRDQLVGLITLVARQGKVAHMECYGQMDREAGKPMEIDAIFRIYSMSKPITSVALMMLVEQGRLLLADPVSKYIPAFKDLKVFAGHSDGVVTTVPLERPMTVHHLLTHTAGLGYGLFTDSPVEDMFRASGIMAPMGKLKLPLEELMQRLAQLPLSNQPGARWRYSMATDTLGYLVQLLSGMPFADFLTERIFRPLGMRDTGFFVPADKLHRFAACYTPALPAGPGGVPLPTMAAGDAAKPGSLLVDAPAKSPFLTPEAPPSGGGLVSTTADYLRFAQMLLNQGELDGVRLLGRKAVELMTTNHLPAELLPLRLGLELRPGIGFGLGVSVRINDDSGVLGSVGSFG